MSSDFAIVHDAWRRLGEGAAPEDPHDRWFTLELGLVLDGPAAALRRDCP